MAQVSKIDSNVTGLSFAEESTFKTLPGTPVWYPLEPNGYNDFGGNLTTVARNPINAGRQRKKGVVTDMEAGGGFNNDLTQSNLQLLLQGFFFASLRRKDEYGDGSGVITAVASPANTIAGTAIGTGVAVGQLLLGTGFTNSGNNVLMRVTTVAADLLTVAETLTAEASPPAAAKVTTVGVQATAGDLDVVITGAFTTITSTTLDFTTLGLVPGEWIYVGGDTAGTSFANAANNGFKRVRSIAANALVLDKSDSPMVAESSTTETVRMFFGRVLKNESASASQVRRSYNLERTLGAPDDASPSQIQSEYLVGAVPSELTVNVPSADKVNLDLAFMAADHETRTGAVGVKSGTRKTLVEADAFNTSSAFQRIKMAVVSTTDEAPTALFAYLTELTLTINNNLSLAKAVGVLGAFEVTAGNFTVDGDITAYFSNISSIAAVRSNSDVTLDMIMAQNNAGIAIDLPLVGLGDGRASVEQDQPITMPLSMQAASGAKVVSTMDHTLLMVFWDYLPTAAM